MMMKKNKLLLQMIIINQIQLKYNKISKTMRFQYISLNKLRTQNIRIQKSLKINKLQNNNRTTMLKKKFKQQKYNNQY